MGMGVGRNGLEGVIRIGGRFGSYMHVLCIVHCGLHDVHFLNCPYQWLCTHRKPCNAMDLILVSRFLHNSLWEFHFHNHSLEVLNAINSMGIMSHAQF